jgi:hypothetical protein
MANTTLTIKKSSATAAPGSLANGELAYSSITDVLYIGSPNGLVVTPIGGKRFPGTLTANQALIANSTLGIDKVQVANLVTLQSVWANGATGSPGNVLISGGPGANAYWGTSGAGAAGGSNNQVQINESGSASGGASLTFNWNSDLNLGVGNNVLANGVILGGVAASNLIANSTVSLALQANTLSLTTALPVGSGGTGTNIGGWTGNNVAISVAGAAVTPILQAGDGTVLQSQAGTIAFAMLDGGSF